MGGYQPFRNIKAFILCTERGVDILTSKYIFMLIRNCEATALPLSHRRRYMAGILPIRRKTPNNQSIKFRHRGGFFQNYTIKL